MEYERIHKVQIGIISPSKLRMKLLGSQHSKSKEGESASRVSPSKIDGMENAKRNLLKGDHDEEGQEANQTKFSTRDYHSEENPADTKNLRNQSNVMNSSCQILQPNNFAALSIRQQDEGGNGYDSGHDNASTTSFEFHGGEKMNQNHPFFGPFYRHIPSKWNDAEKWLVNRQTTAENALKKSSALYQCNRTMNSSLARIAPELVITDQKPSVNLLENNKTGSHNMAQEFMHSDSISSNASSCLTDPSHSCDSISLAPVMKNHHKESAVSESRLSESTDIPSKHSISMRDVGTEMTPIPSQDPSRTGTPIEHLTPSRSPISSITSSPRRSIEVDMVQPTTRNVKDDLNDVDKKEFSEKELKLKIRREIAALGFQLGKLKIASWASKEAESISSPKTIDEDEQLRKEYEYRAIAWEDAERAKRMSRYKQEQIKIQAWESQQREKCEAIMRKAEIRAENMRSRAEATLAAKLRRTKQRAKEKRFDAETKKNMDAAKTSQKAERIRRSGQVPSTHVRCFSWLLQISLKTCNYV